ncbi:MAG: SDR family NAD(P)-dependent oxidoreductase [Candidatus Coatesbacteria bacterium]|nr:SDR family NAD(P)-dependent oxidoreductase [Candidatus Coatesbacteria bacterium]
MATKVLVTGGAGFIGSHLVDRLLEGGYEVTVYDSLEKQVHGEDQKIPDYLSKKAEFIKGDVRDRDSLYKAIKGKQVVFHEAAAVGVGQSMYEIARYTDINTMGGAILLDILANEKHQVEKVLVASSMSIYGEGKYDCKKCGAIFPKLRPESQMAAGDWEMHCPKCGAHAKPLPTDEEKPLYPTSIYAVNKRDHEEMFISTGVAYKLPTVALRYFNVYGPRQALSNPYTGVCAIFGSRILNDHSPIIFEDGLQSRDFINVRDIAEANVLALESDNADYQVFNVGSGKSISVLEIANILIDRVGKVDGLAPQIVKKFRAGDIRHCFADITKIKTLLGFKPSISFEDGMTELTEWVASQTADDSVEKALEELKKRNLTS